jgi:hypothetical protein
MIVNDLDQLPTRRHSLACIIALLDERCSRDPFAIETRLNRADLKKIGPKKPLHHREIVVGATGIEPVTPTMSR